MNNYPLANKKFSAPLDVAIIMQGPVLRDNCIDLNFVSNLKKVRKNFPASRIIVSCWEMSDENKRILNKISHFYDFDVVFNKDPGGLTKIIGGAKYICNLNRMILSTSNALNKVKNEYTVKIRTDTYFSNDFFERAFQNYYNQIDESLARDSNYVVFKKRIINGNLFARNPRGYLPYLFHPGDILLAGLTSDLKKLFSADFADETIFSVSYRKSFYTMMRFVPEQYLWVKCIFNVTSKAPFDGNHVFSNILVAESEKYFVNNFYLVENDTVGFCWPKHKTHYNNKGRYSVYDSSDWDELYNKYVCQTENENKTNLKKLLISLIMIGYFTVRTFILKIPFMRAIAVKIFSKRG